MELPIVIGISAENPSHYRFRDKKTRSTDDNAARLLVGPGRTFTLSDEKRRRLKVIDLGILQRDLGKASDHVAMIEYTKMIRSLLNAFASFRFWFVRPIFLFRPRGTIPS